MLSTQRDLILKYIHELLIMAPSGWERIVLYREFGSEDGEKIPVETFEWWSKGIRSYEFSATALAERYMLDYYNECIAAGNDWVAIKLEVSADGSYRTEYFYEGTPMFNGDYDAMTARIEAPFSKA